MKRADLNRLKDYFEVLDNLQLMLNTDGLSSQHFVKLTGVVRGSDGRETITGECLLSRDYIEPELKKWCNDLIEKIRVLDRELYPLEN